ncbi:MAG TPA: hypothetical protein VFM97_00325 [Gammaproteobacteria bacterium]|nr:hypothetical protein [Gammaproteobacteria bacterium]
MKVSVDQAMEFLFTQPREPRSPFYKAGVRAALAKRLDDQSMKCPHLPGSVESDAWYSGTLEGHRVGREILQR